MTEKKKILVIDDEKDLVDLVQYQLEAKGYEVQTANNGLEGFEKLKTFTPNLIILDINMPEVGGIEFYSKISTAQGKSKYPVLILTARADLENTFIDIEVDGFMAKPFEIDNLVAEVGRMVSGASNSVIYLIEFQDRPIVKKIIDFFHKERYDVVNIEDYRMLEEKVKKKKPKVIIMEYMQRGITGEDFIKKVKNNSLLQDCSIIVYSYSGLKEYEEKSLNAGADFYLDKPKNFDVFRDAVSELLNQK